MASRPGKLDENYVHVAKVVGGYSVARRKGKKSFAEPLAYRFDGPAIDHIRAFTNGARRVLTDKDWDAFLGAIGVKHATG